MELVHNIIWLVVLPHGRTCPTVFLVQCFCLHLPTNVLWSAHHASARERQETKKKTQTRRELEFIGMQQHVWLDMYTVTITHYKKGKERERVTHMKSWRVSSPVWTCTELSIPWAQCLCFWSCQLCAALSDGSPNESFGPRSSTGKKPGPQREVSKRNSNLRVLGERRQTAYQRLIKP